MVLSISSYVYSLTPIFFHYSCFLAYVFMTFNHTHLFVSKRTIANCRINRSHILLSSKPLMEMKTTQRMHVIIGTIDVNVPQHPGILRTIITRFSKRLEKHFIEINHYRTSKRYRRIFVNQSNQFDILMPFRMNIVSATCSGDSCVM